MPADKIHFQIIKNVTEAEKIWKIFFVPKTIYSDWEFRYCFYKYFNYELFFYVGYVNDEPVGLLPLQFNTDKGYLEFFGGDYMEDNEVFIKKGYEEYVPEFYKQVTKKAKLEYIIGEDVFTTSLEIKDYKYVLPLKDLKDYEDYLTVYYQGKELREFRRKIRNIESKKLKIIINNFNDIEALFRFNKLQFEDSSFNEPYREQIFRDLLKPPFQTQLVTYLDNDSIVAVSLGIIYGEVMESFNTGIAEGAPKNLREYIYLNKIDNAIKMRLKYFDSFVGAYGWKDKWHFSKIPQYKF